MDDPTPNYKLSDMVNIEPFLAIGIKKEDTEPLLFAIYSLLQASIDEEISNTLTEEDENLVKETFAPDDNIRIAIAYDELYREKTGKSLQDFSKTKLTELIEQTAKFIKAQYIYIEKLNTFNEGQISKFIELVDQEKLDEAERMLKG